MERGITKHVIKGSIESARVGTNNLENNMSGNRYGGRRVPESWGEIPIVENLQVAATGNHLKIRK